MERAKLIGPYELLAPLGAGASGRLYKARRRDSGAVVALKAPRLDIPSNAHDLRREIDVFKRLPAHRNVVRLLDEGQEAGAPWFAMELIEGRTLREMFEPLTGSAREEAIGRLLSIQLPKICGALDHLHAHSVVHGDLHPGNVLLREDGDPVLVDFGLASRLTLDASRSRIATVREVAGTPGFVAPEVARGDGFDARADLYSLGAILHWIIHRVPPSAQGAAVSANPMPNPIEALVARLLLPDPRARVPYAADVASMLSEGALEETSHVVHLYRPSLVGRERELGALEQHLTRAAEGAGGVVAITGDSGIGKTRLAGELARRAQASGFRVVVGQATSLAVEAESAGAVACAPMEPLKPLLQHVADLVRSRGGRTRELLLGDESSLPLYEPAVAALPAVRVPPGLMSATGPEFQARVANDLVRLIQGLAGERPLLLVVDDVQWADELTRHVLGFFAQGALATQRALVCVTCRTEAGPSFIPLGAQQLPLGGLESRDAAEMVCEMLASDRGSDAWRELVLEEAAGNPFFVAEYLHAAVHTGALKRAPLGRWEPVQGASLTTPGTLRKIFDGWFDALEPDTQRVVRLLSAAGREFEAGELFEPSSTTVRALQHLTVRGVLEPAENGRLRFVHDRFRQHAYGTMPEDARSSSHLEIAGRLEPRLRGLPGGAAVLSHHLYAGRAYARAAPYLEQAGREALNVGANLEAARLLDRALSCWPAEGDGAANAPERRAELHRLIGESKARVGDLAGTIAQGAASLRLLARPLPARPAGWLGRLCIETAAQVWHRWAPASWHRSSGPQQRVRARTEAAMASRLCETYYFTQEMLPLAAMSFGAVNAGERGGQIGHAPRDYARLGYMLGLWRLHRTAAGYFERAQRAASVSEDRGAAAAAYWYEASYRITFAQWARARQTADQAIEMLTADGALGDLEIARTLRANVDYYQGQLVPALDTFETIRKSARRNGTPQYETWATYGIARSQIGLERFAEAAEALDDALRLVATQADRVSEFIIRALRSLCLARLDRWDEGLAEAERALELARGRLPTAFVEDRGYEAIATVFVEAAARRATPEFERRARESASLHSQCAAFFPLARSAASRLRGRLAWLQGHHRSAVRHWNEALAAALETNMRTDAELVRTELALARRRVQ